VAESRVIFLYWFSYSYCENEYGSCWIRLVPGNLAADEKA